MAGITVGRTDVRAAEKAGDKTTNLGGCPVVRVERLKRAETRSEPDAAGARYLPIEVFVQVPTTQPSEASKVSARPYEFEGEIATKFSSSCPHCGQGIWFGRHEMNIVSDNFFIACPNCGQGTAYTVQSMIDPFVNPINEKIAEAVLDAGLDSVHTLTDSDQRSVLEKFENAADDDCSPDDQELDNMTEGDDKDPSEIEQILEELEGKL